MSEPHGPVPSPEQPEPAQPASEQPAPAQSTVPPAAVPPAADPSTRAAPPAQRRGTGFTVLVAAVTALVVALVVAGGTAVVVARQVADKPHRVTIDVGRSDSVLPDGGSRPGWSDQRPGRGADGDANRPEGCGGSGTDSQDGRDSTGRGSTDQESQPGS